MAIASALLALHTLYFDIFHFYQRLPEHGRALAPLLLAALPWHFLSRMRLHTLMHGRYISILRIKQCRFNTIHIAPSGGVENFSSRVLTVLHDALNKPHYCHFSESIHY